MQESKSVLMLILLWRQHSLNLGVLCRESRLTMSGRRGILFERQALPAVVCFLSTPPEARCQADRGINRRWNFVKFNDTDDQLEKIIFAVVFSSCPFSGRKILEKICLYLLTFVSRSFILQRTDFLRMGGVTRKISFYFLTDFFLKNLTPS